MDALSLPFDANTLTSVALFLAAIVLVVLEIFIPSAGVLGILAAISLMASVGFAFAASPATGVIMLLVELVVVPFAIAGAVKVWPHTPMGKLILAKRPETEDEVLPDTEEYHRDELVGKRGVAKSALLPSGDVVIEGQVYDSVSSGMPIDAGQAVIVVGVDTQRLIVRVLGGKEIVNEERVSTDDVLSTPIDSLGIEPFDEPLA